MAFVEPGSGRARIEHTGADLRIVIPVKKQASVLALMPLGWITAGIVLVLGPIKHMRHSSPPDLIFLGIFACFAGMSVLTWLWTLAGKEIISVTTQNLTKAKSLFGVRIKRSFDSSLAHNWRVIPGAPTGSMSVGKPYQSGFTGGTIAFDYGLKTVRFGIFLEEAEARHIIDELKRHGYIRDEAA